MSSAFAATFPGTGAVQLGGESVEKFRAERIEIEVIATPGERQYSAVVITPRGARIVGVRRSFKSAMRLAFAGAEQVTL